MPTIYNPMPIIDDIWVEIEPDVFVHTCYNERDLQAFDNNQE